MVECGHLWHLLADSEACILAECIKLFVIFDGILLLFAAFRSPVQIMQWLLYFSMMVNTSSRLSWKSALAFSSVGI